MLRVIGKVEITSREENPGFVVSPLLADDPYARGAYAQIYCAPGNMENRIQ